MFPGLRVTVCYVGLLCGACFFWLICCGTVVASLLVCC